MTGRSSRLLLVLVWVLLPAAWLVLTGVVATHVERGATLALVVLGGSLFLGLPLTVAWLSRRVSARARTDGALVFHTRRPALRQILPPPVPEAPRPPRARVGPRARTASVLLLAAMFAISLSLWTAVPVAWVWIGSHLSHTGEPGVLPYLLIIVGIPVTIAVGVRTLYRWDAAYARLTRRAIARERQTAWLKSVSDARVHRAWGTVDALMTVSVIVALVVMAVWFGFFAEQRSMLDAYMR